VIARAIARRSPSITPATNCSVFSLMPLNPERISAKFVHLFTNFYEETLTYSPTTLVL
jgi:hypothetical protein